jgi:hypothetical protein
VREVDRLKIKPPPTVALASPFDMEIDFPKEGIVGAELRCHIGDEKFDRLQKLSIVEGRGGHAIGRIVPLITGSINCVIAHPPLCRFTRTG